MNPHVVVVIECNGYTRFFSYNHKQQHGLSWDHRMQDGLFFSKNCRRTSSPRVALIFGFENLMLWPVFSLFYVGVSINGGTPKSSICRR